MVSAGAPSSLLVIIALLTGVFGLPLGVPPLPPDDALMRSAPDECLFFVSSSGIGQPETSNENHTDQLLADEQVQTFLSEFAQQINNIAKQLGEKDENLKPIFEDGKPLVEVLLSRPMAIYLERVEMAQDGPSTPVGGLIVHCGDRKTEVKNAIDSLEGKFLQKNEAGDDAIKDVKIGGASLRQAIVGPGIELDWGFKDKYFMIAIGPGAAGDLLKRVSGSGPQAKWLTALQKQAAVKRVSTILYLNAARVLELAAPLLPGEKTQAGIAASGLGDLISYASVTGLGTKGILSRSFANFKSAPTGLFALLDAKPLAADDLKPIPAKAMAAGAVRFDLTRFYKAALEVAQAVDPEATDRFKQQAAGLAQGMGFRLEEDILGSFGDVWTFHTAGGVGPVIGPGFTAGAVLTVTVKNKEMMGKLQDLVVNMAKMQQAQLPFNLSETKIGEIKAYQVVGQTGSIAPAWALTGSHLVVGDSIDALKTQLRRATDSQSLADVAAVASRLKTGAVMLTYQDTKTILTQLLAIVQGFGPLGIGMLAQQGIKDVELPTIPDMEQIAPHVLPRTSTLRVSKQAIISEAYDTVPLVGSLMSSAPTLGVVAALLMPAVQQAREAARRSQVQGQIESGAK